MRGATQCAQRLRRLLRALRTRLGKVARPATSDPMTQVILGILSRDVPESKARQALDRLRAVVVDYNELRVVPSMEMADMVGAIPNARVKCEDLSRALNKVFAREHEVSLDRLRGQPKKEVIEYLSEIDGLDAYSRARVRLLGLEQHAVPLDEAMWAYARKQGIVDQKCSLEEAQGFLERRLSEEEALEFVALVERQAWEEMGAAVRDGEVERISSIPPDRTTRNMLQLVAGSRDGAVSTRPDVQKTIEADEVSAAGSTVRGDGATGAKKAGKSARKKASKKPQASKPAKKRQTLSTSRPAPRKQATKRKSAKAKTKARTKTKAKAKTKKLDRKTKKKTGRVAAKAKKPAAAATAKRARRTKVRAKSA